MIVIKGITEYSIYRKPFVSSFACSFAENKTCKRNSYLVNQLLSQSIFAHFFADPFAEIHVCKESANVIYHRLSTFFFADSFASSFAVNQTCKRIFSVINHRLKQTTEVAELEAKVNAHLQNMGFLWN